jgi:hypothetical protein
MADRSSFHMVPLVQTILYVQKIILFSDRSNIGQVRFSNGKFVPKVEYVVLFLNDWH